jgi:FkbM family methyltransferase
MISYAQNGEDVVLERVFAEVKEGFYIDVGASDPLEDSVTNHFYERGWRGVNIEPDPHEFKRLAAARERDINLEAVVGSGVGPLSFYPSSVRGHGTVDAGRASKSGETTNLKVPQISLAAIFAEHAPRGGVDFLKIDVEGVEADVIASGDWKRDRPRVVVVEAVDATGRPTHERWELVLLEHGYSFALFDGLNRFYVRDEDGEQIGVALAAPANPFDEWTRAREVALEQALQQRLRELDAIAAQQIEAHDALSREQEAHGRARRELQDAQSAVAAERTALERTKHELTTVYDSTSWRLTAPVRDASRLVRMMRRDGAAQCGSRG